MSHAGEILRDPFVFVVPLLLLCATVLGGLILRRVLFHVVRGWAQNDNHLDVLITESLRGPIVLWSLILGLHIATQNSEIPVRYLRHIPSALALLWILSLTIAMSRLAGNTVRFYGGRVTGGVRPVTSLTQKLAQIIVVILGLAWMCRVVFNINLTPILATLGVGGLAVALALQDTLSNLFAGFYVSISGFIRIGDYIKLNSGEEGYVSDITWRSTTMRGTNNNLVVIPNNKLGQATFTNYFLPERRMVLQVTFTVAHDSDVDRVEAVLLDEVMASVGVVPSLIADPAPHVRFIPGPGDSGLGFQVNFNVAEYADQFLVQSELRKRIFKRLKRENIALAFTTRTVILEPAQTELKPEIRPDIKQ